MDARKLTIAEFLSFKNTKFIIPVYQRNYDWKKENCQQLFDDIKTIGQSSHHDNHFMGAIVYVASDDTILIDSREYVIIDGQQRITTATLFLKALPIKIGINLRLIVNSRIFLSNYAGVGTFYSKNLLYISGST